MMYMKRINIYICALLSIFAVSSCDLTELDNYKDPDAEIHGSILDAADNVTLVEQDIVNGGSIEYVEDYIKDVENPPKQNLIYKQNGTYRNSRLFAAEYLYFVPVNANFIADTLRSWPKPASGAKTDRVVLSKGDNEINWIVEPNCRIKELTIVDDKVNKQIVATFKVVKSSHAKLASNVINQVGLYCHMTQGICGQPNKIYEQTSNPTAAQSADPNTVYTLRQPYGTSGSSRLINGQKYFFRVGARVNTSANRFNYATEERFTLQW